MQDEDDWVIDRVRLLRTVEQLATFGATKSGGVDRPALSNADLDARRFLVDLALGIGLEVRRDAAANLFIRLAGREEELPPVTTGSHVDSQPTGGKLDGAYGVCAGLEVLRSLAAASTDERLLRSIDLVIWTNEEGSRFAPGAMGSSVFVDPRKLPGFLAATDAHGMTFHEALSNADREFSDIPLIELERPFHSFVELHIEQGPVLERDGVDIGVVVGVQGCRWYGLSASGRAAHAGTTPPLDRLDPLRSLHQLMSEVYDWSVDDDLRATVGAISARPGSTNTVPELAEATLDLRHPSLIVLDDLENRLRKKASSTFPSVEVTRQLDLAPTQFSEDLSQLVEESSIALGLTCQRILSGAFHDAVHLNSHCPTTMIFVPSNEGVSHHPAESTEPEALVNGAQVLASVLCQVANKG